MTAQEQHEQHRFRIALCFGLVYLFWGSTYLAIRIGVEHIGPLYMTGSRFVIAGTLMLVWCALTGRGVKPTWPELWRVGLIGVLLLTGGNTGVAWGEQFVPSGLAALIVAAVPIYILLIESVIFRGDRLHARGLAGLGLGIVGIVVLLWPKLMSDSVLDHKLVIGAGGLLLASASWALGSVLSRRWKMGLNVFSATGWEMLAAGVVNLVLGTLFGERATTTWTLRGVGAIAYLIVFGSWVGYSAYIWLLNHVPTSKVATYAYVNPVVAVFLGWLILRERVDGYIIAGTVIVIAAVALVNSSKVKEASKPVVEEVPVEAGAD